MPASRPSLSPLKILWQVVYFAILALILLVFLAPLLWMLLNSFKTPLQIIKLPPDLIFTPTLDNYINVFRYQNFAQYIWNSVLIAAGCTALGLLIGLPAAHSIARYKQRMFGVIILVARIVPGITFLIPLYIIYRQLGLIDTYLSLILSHALVTLPFIVWVMVPFFETIPHELEEAARVDGWQAGFRPFAASGAGARAGSGRRAAGRPSSRSRRR